jgi:hypothetical protein
VPWINQHLTAKDRIIVDQRQLMYLIDPPVFYGHFLDYQGQGAGAQALIDPTRPPDVFRKQLRAQGITHAMIAAQTASDGAFRGEGAYVAQIERLRRAGCATPVASIPGIASQSRTEVAMGINKLAPSERHNLIVRLDMDRCPPL